MVTFQSLWGQQGWPALFLSPSHSFLSTASFRSWVVSKAEQGWVSLALWSLAPQMERSDRAVAYVTLSYSLSLAVSCGCTPAFRSCAFEEICHFAHWIGYPESLSWFPDEILSDGTVGKSLIVRAWVPRPTPSSAFDSRHSRRVNADREVCIISSFTDTYTPPPTPNIEISI